MKSNVLNIHLNVSETNDILSDVSEIIQQSKELAYRSIDIILLQRNWLIGKRIHEEELKETRKENYGKEIIKNLSKELIAKYGKGFDVKTLYKYVSFYILYKNIFSTASRQSFLSWSHYVLLFAIDDVEARDWYEKEALKCAWSVRTLQRNIATQYYYRLVSSQSKGLVKKEMEDKTLEYQLNKLEHVKNPVVLEFLGLSKNEEHYESEIETAIINNLQKMIMELGKGYAFVGRQYHIKTERRDYYIDLVFYNYILKCFVLVDLKIDELSHSDIGQMDMYVRMFDDLKRTEGDNPTIGLLLCAETSADMAKYSVLHGNNQLFATKYLTFLPTEEELRNEIEQQKHIYALQKHSK